MNDDLHCFILAGGEGSRLGNLTKDTCKPLIKICSHYHLIDFSLINCLRANILNISVIVQYESRDLIQYFFESNIHLLSNFSILPPRTSKLKKEEIEYKNTAHSVHENRGVLEDSVEDVLILSADHVYAMDYVEFVNYHREKDADLTISSCKVPIEEASRFGVFTIDDNGSVLDFQEKPENPQSDMVSMGVYVFKREPLARAMIELSMSKGMDIDFGKDVIPYFLEHYNVSVYNFEWPWLDIGTVKAFWEVNMNFLDRSDYIDYFFKSDRRFKVSTAMLQSKPSFIEVNADVKSSLIGKSALIRGDIVHSVIGDGVVVESGVYIKNSVIMDNCEIKKGVCIENAVISQNSVIDEDVICSEDEIKCI